MNLHFLYIWTTEEYGFDRLNDLTRSAIKAKLFQEQGGNREDNISLH